MGRDLGMYILIRIAAMNRWADQDCNSATQSSVLLGHMWLCPEDLHFGGLQCHWWWEDKLVLSSWLYGSMGQES